MSTVEAAAGSGGKSWSPAGRDWGRATPSPVPAVVSEGLLQLSTALAGEIDRPPLNEQVYNHNIPHSIYL